jgi:hypothetical protein
MTNEFDETTCQFVSSRGLLKSCDVRAKIPLSSCPTNLEYIEEFIKSQVPPSTSSSVSPSPSPSPSPPVSIYVCGDAIQTFISKYVPMIQIPFVVVSGDGDKIMFRETVPSGQTMFVMFILYANMRGLYSQNMDIRECRAFLTDKITKLWTANAKIFKTENAPKTLEEAITGALSKLRQIPIGMDYHTITANPTHRWISKGVTVTTPFSQEQTLIQDIRGSMVPFYSRRILIYSNVMLCLDRFRDRISAASDIPRALLYHQKEFIPRFLTWKNMTQFAFVLSPFGNGLDCRRTWEALLCGCIPIVRSTVFKELFEGLPVLIVEKWKDITLTLLQQTLHDFKLKHDNNEFQYEKLTLEYYTNWWKPK